MVVTQWPACGSRLVLRRGDLLDVRLNADTADADGAWLRTNVGRAAVRRQEIIGLTEAQRPMLARDWHDIPMVRAAPGHYRLRLPLLETGVFEAKAFLTGPVGKPVWPAGENLRIRVQPAHTVCANTVYTAFPRQFGPASLGRGTAPAAEQHAVDLLDGRGYAVVPPSGTFRDLVRHLDVIMGQMGFRILQLLPVHPVPTTFARLGRFGSPFAATDFFGVDPGMAEFDRMATPMAQFEELLEAVHSRGGYVFLDLPANHTAWASWLQLHHPEWFCRTPDGSFVNPGAWGVVWEDLCKLDFRCPDLWRYMADVFLHWCGKGVDGFRCDAGYMVPAEAWRYITARVRDEFPDTVFFLEGLGGPQDVTEALLGEAGLDWAYSELFQSLSGPEVTSCLRLSSRLSRERGTMVHFAETHDNNRLAAVSPSFSRFRCALSAMVSHEGAFGITNGVEWFAAAKLDVHGASPLNWGARLNQVEELRHLNGILQEHPAFRAGTWVEPVAAASADLVGLLRRPADGNPVLVLANLHDREAREATWPAALMRPSGGRLWDLLGRRDVAVGERSGTAYCQIDAQTVLCLEPGAAAAPAGPAAEPPGASRIVPPAVLTQQFRALALDLRALHDGLGDVSAAATEPLGEELRRDPVQFVASLYRREGYTPLVQWQLGRDERRVVMVPPRHVLMVRAAHPFVAEVWLGLRCVHRSRSLPWLSNGHFTMVLPLAAQPAGVRYELRLHVFSRPIARLAADLVALGDSATPAVCLSVDSGHRVPDDLHALCTGANGALAQVRGQWGEIRSQYDALFAANLHPDHPVDRTVLLTRCRAWLVHRDYSQEVGVHCQTRFGTDLAQRVRWEFRVPVGMGCQVPLAITLEMAENGRGVHLHFRRGAAAGVPDGLSDATPVTLIVRPDIENRSSHGVTRAFEGPEQAFPQGVRAAGDGFVFAPAGGHELACSVTAGSFVSEPEWHYLVPHPVEVSRGLAAAGDLFSPGYFRCALAGESTVVLTATAGDSPAVWSRLPADAAALPVVLPLEEALRRALRQFIVRRGESWTVVAGYPWFLDWGRDTLICLRGAIAAGMLEESRAILRLFARFEAHGTLPNMIRGADARDRDTSDAPLWLSVAVADYLQTPGGEGLLDDDCGGRPLRRVLADVGTAILAGTGNGICADPETGLVFSPAHFTWMDTNHPAGSPREGFPIEIQALWYRALVLLAALDEPGPRWGDLASRVRDAVIRLYTRGSDRGLCDCLHGAPGTPAQRAQPDDACRPNQLLAVTLGLIDDKVLARQIVAACWPLLVPGGIRSLADQPVAYPLPIRHREALLNDPGRPYWGRYEGDEDTRRKPAYHNGTAWSWLYPSFAEALVAACGPAARPAAWSLLCGMVPVLESGCLGQVPEIVDGDAPHLQRGCGAQAWGVSELLRLVLTFRPDEANGPG